MTRDLSEDNFPAVDSVGGKRFLSFFFIYEVSLFARCDFLYSYHLTFSKDDASF